MSFKKTETAKVVQRGEKRTDRWGAFNASGTLILSLFIFW